MRRGILRSQGLFIVLALLWACNPAWSDTYGKGLLWAVTSPDGKTSHILGTIHSSNPKMDLERFGAYLERQAESIRSKTGCREIQFRLAVEDGKMKLKAKPIRQAS